MPIESSGTLLYRKTPGGLQVLIVRPAGPAARWGWSIPKGLPDAGESLEATARRETREETGVSPGDLTYLGFVVYRKSGKRIHCYAAEAGSEEPRPDRREIAEARFVSPEDARKKLHPDQRPLVDRLLTALGRASP